MIVDIGGRHMEPSLLWNLFLETGAPELYLLYQKAVQGAYDVLEDRRSGPAGDGL